MTTRGTAWIVDRRFDWTWLVGSVVICPVLPILNEWAGMSWQTLAFIYLLLFNNPHFFSTWTMTYFDSRALRERFLVLAVPLVAAAVFVATCLATGREWLMMTVILYYGAWHFIRQSYGILALHKLRNGDLDPFDRVLDEVVMTWGPIYLLGRRASPDYQLMGQPVWTPVVPGPLMDASAVAIAGLLVLFAYRQVRLARQAGRCYAFKCGMVAATYAAFGYASFGVTDTAASYLAPGTWHCVQYMAMVWAYQRGKMQRVAGVQPAAIHALFGTPAPGRYLTAAYTWGAALVTLIFTAFPGEQARAFAMGLVFTTQAFTHYALDGFLWTRRRGISLGKALQV